MYTLTLDMKEIEYIGAVLGDRPYREALPVIKKLEQQVNEQIAVAEKAKEAPAGPPKPKSK